MLRQQNIKNLNTNQLTGEIPSEVCDLNINYVNFYGNKFCSPYPPSCISQSDINSQDTSNCP